MVKGLRLLMVVLLLLWTLPFVGVVAYAVAEEAGLPVPIDYMTPADFATFAGQVTFVVAMAQFLKLPADKLFGGHIKTSYIVYLLAMVGQVLSRLILPDSGGLSWGVVPTMLIWAFFVAWAAMVAYDKLIASVEAKKAENAAITADAAPTEKPPGVAVT